jgi:hypothetical protein
MLPAGLDRTLSGNATVADVPTSFSARDRQRVRRAFKVGRTRDWRDEQDLVAQIDRLHGIALSAIREHQASEWREIGTLYEFVLLALPKEAKALNLPFTGAIAAPGAFGFGPLQRIEGNLFKELDTALELNDAELVDAISYLPGKVAREAGRLGAYPVVRSMLRLYPAMYSLVRSRRR